MQPGDVPAIYANTDALDVGVDRKLDTPVETNAVNFVNWYCDYFNDTHYLAVGSVTGVVHNTAPSKTAIRSAVRNLSV